MIERIYGALFFGVFAVFLFVQSPHCLRAASLGPIKKVSLKVPFLVKQAAQDAIVEKLTAMKRHRFVYLDLSIAITLGPGGTMPYVLTKNGQPPRAATKNCEFGALLMGRGLTYELGPIADYNHLLLSIVTGDRADFPYNDVSCEYKSRGDEGDFHVRGFFYVLENSVPTALALQLRPFNPPYEVARKVLAVN